MGEIHYSRIPQAEWQQEVRKMKDGGVTIIATYVFWNHVEEQQGIFRWDGQRNLRQFLEVCKAEQMPVVLRIGPFCHGEVRCGGIPDWMYNPSLTLPEGEGTSKPIRMRSEDPRFLFFVERLYRQIFTQVQGLQWKDGGPVMACQFDNEYRGRGSYLMALKKMALCIGFDLPFYTRTGWPELATPVPYGEMLPLYGDYADGFWERSLAETAGSYYKAFNFRAPSGLGENMGALDTTNSLPAGENRGIVTPSPFGEGRGGALNIRLVPNLGLGADDFLLQAADAQHEVAFLECPTAVGTHEGHALGRQTERHRLHLTRLQLHLREIAQTTIVGCQRCNDIARVEQHGFLAGTRARVLHIDAYGNHIVGGELGAVGTQIAIFKRGVRQAIAEWEQGISEITIRAALHRVVLIVRQLVAVLVERNRKFS
jgi:hypothetical protein